MQKLFHKASALRYLEDPAATEPGIFWTDDLGVSHCSIPGIETRKEEIQARRVNVQVYLLLLSELPILSCFVFPR